MYTSRVDVTSARVLPARSRLPGASARQRYHVKPSKHPGFLLVASPELQDPHFERSVVLMVQHDAEGAYGLVLNRPLTRTLSDVLESAGPRWAGVPLHVGGPVQTNLLQFVVAGDGPGRLVVPGLAVGSDLAELAQGPTEAACVRAYLGYAGWGGGQLERETSEGSWIVRPAEARHVFGIPSEHLWATVLRELGGNYAWMSLSGGDPTVN